MSVYAKEHADYLKQSIESILSQTVLSDDIVIVCDGALTRELDDVLDSFADKIRLIRLPENQGLGKALNAGLSECRHDLVARMDSDDIKSSSSCSLQIQIFLSRAARSKSLAARPITPREKDLSRSIMKR